MKLGDKGKHFRKDEGKNEAIKAGYPSSIRLVMVAAKASKLHRDPLAALDEMLAANPTSYPVYYGDKQIMAGELRKQVADSLWRNDCLTAPHCAFFVGDGVVYDLTTGHKLFAVK